MGDATGDCTGETTFLGSALLDGPFFASVTLTGLAFGLVVLLRSRDLLADFIFGTFLFLSLECEFERLEQLMKDEDEEEEPVESSFGNDESLVL